jgi:hypothetical protein
VQAEYLDEQILQFGQKHAAKRGKRIVIGMQIASDETEWHHLIGSTLNLP